MPNARRARRAAGRGGRRGAGIPVVVPGAVIGPSATVPVRLALAPGQWQLEADYASRFPIQVTAPGLNATLPPNLDRPGPRWPIGRLTVHGRAPSLVTFRVGDSLLAPITDVTELDKVVATRDVPVRIVSVLRACGRYVDWYRGARR